MARRSRSIEKAVWLTVAVASLGYFVDIYDLLLFGIVRIPSLRAIGVEESEIMAVGLRLLNFQMSGMLFGGILWGILGDRRGRKSVLFASILLYSLCNIANAYVKDAQTYAWLRFFAGIGLAGELGAAVTLITELMPRQSRGYGTAIVASVGVLGAVCAALVGEIFNWQTAFLVGGFMGLGLLAVRAGLPESGMFRAMVSNEAVQRGHFHRLLSRPRALLRYFSCIAIGVPIWFVAGILITLAPELSRGLGVDGEVTGGGAILWFYLGTSAGDFCAGVISQWLKSRKKAVLIFLTATALLVLVYFFLPPKTAALFYALCGLLGFGAGYWAIFITIAAEQFGTNIRATVSTTVPNLVRSTVVPIVIGLEFLRARMDTMRAILIVGVAVFALAYISLYLLNETFGKNLDYFE